MIGDSIMAQLIIVSDPETRVIVDAGTDNERTVMVYRLTLTVGGVSFTVAETQAVHWHEAADAFALTLARALR